MKKIISVMVLISIIFTMFTSCATTYYVVEVSNVRNIREIYIRNAGTANWGANMAGNLQNIDRSKFSDRVDVRVVDTNGIIYSKLNVPFNEAAFQVTDQSSSVNSFLGLALLIGGIAAVSAIME